MLSIFSHLTPRSVRTATLLFATATIVLGACSGGHDTVTKQQADSESDAVAPSTPVSLAVTATAPAYVDLSWNASTDNVAVVGYRIYRNGAATALAQVANVTTYRDTTVTSNTTYSYTVSAYDAAGNSSAKSTAVNATTPATSTTGGLDSRPSNTSCLAGAPPSSGTVGGTATLEDTFNSGLPNFNLPVLALQAPGDSSFWYVVEKTGQVKRFANNATTTAASVFIDVSDLIDSGPNEAGLLGMAFAPTYPTDNRIFLSYTAPGLVSKIASFKVINGTPDKGSKLELISINQPEDNHNGGNIAFGPDGFLYAGFGDGGGGGDGHDPNGNGQTTSTLLGKMLRIDVSPATGYNIPNDNPFASNAKCSPQGNSRAAAACPEIYAWGFRNPWRWSFDKGGTHTLWVGDVGQDAWEEVDTVEKGKNYGWRCREGAHNFNTSGTCSTDIVDPVAEYDHTQGNAVTGGYVYRGTQSTTLAGHYIFADEGSGRMWAWIPESAGGTRTATKILDSNINIASFAQANDGELYVVDISGGRLKHVLFQSGGATNQPPTHLKDTGCVSSTNIQQPASGLIPYQPNAPFWSDGAVKQRWVALPNGQNVAVQSSGDWDLPNGTVLMKNFTIANQLIETRLLKHYTDGTWGGVTYQWNDAQTDATLVTGGATRLLSNGQTWIYPSEAQCVQCHTAAAGGSLGLEIAQLNRNLLYPQTGRTANQLTTFDALHALSPALSASPASLPAYPDPADTTADLTLRARAYLHTNCSQCHRPGGNTPSNMDLRYTTALSATNTCNAAPQAGDVGIGANARLIAPGNAANSVIANRMNRRDGSAMPPVGSKIVDSDGVALITQWINQLVSCQ